MKKNTIGIVSDSHDHRDNIRKAVAVFNQSGAALVLHAGDFISPFTVMDFSALNCPLEMVFGNNDGEKVGLKNAFSDLGTLLPGPRILTAQGKRILLMHEHDCLEAVCAAQAVDVVVYGHTHQAYVRKGAPLVINPGECGGWLKGKATVALLDLTTMEVEIVELNP